MVIDILRNCPLNHKLYSTACGDLKFTGMSNSIIHTHSDRFNKDIDFDENGRLYLFDGCVSDITLLYPSRGNHMWSNWRDVMFSEGDFIFDEVNTKEVYIFSNYDNYDKVLVRNKFGESMLMPTNNFRFATRTEKDNFGSTFVLIDGIEEEEEYKFEVFDKVLVRDDDNDVWKASFYSHPWTSKSGDLFHFTVGCENSGYLQCIPYNDTTKHLVGTANKPN